MSNGVIDLSQATKVEPPTAPVNEPEPLTGKEKAGVSLTWGVLGIIGLFLIGAITFLWWGESNYQDSVETLSKLDVNTLSVDKAQAVNTLLSTAKGLQESFRAFWSDMLQLILLNFLFPVLTALLGYVFGTQSKVSAE